MVLSLLYVCNLLWSVNMISNTINEDTHNIHYVIYHLVHQVIYCLPLSHFLQGF